MIKVITQMWLISSGGKVICKSRRSDRFGSESHSLRGRYSTNHRAKKLRFVIAVKPEQVAVPFELKDIPLPLPPYN
jgi:hypothetical protein